MRCFIVRTKRTKRTGNNLKRAERELKENRRSIIRCTCIPGRDQYWSTLAIANKLHLHGGSAKLLLLLAERYPERCRIV